MSVGNWRPGPNFGRPGAGPLPLRQTRRKITADRWSLHFDRCRGHGGTDVPHEARGLCHNCYQAARKAGELSGTAPAEPAIPERMTLQQIVRAYAREHNQRAPGGSCDCQPCVDLRHLVREARARTAGGTTR